MQGACCLEKDDHFFEDILRIDIEFDIAKSAVVFTGRDKELMELHTMLQNRSKGMISQTASITGLGGIGKSELARKYISEYRDSYEGNLIWINATNTQALTESFRKLAEDKLKINTKNAIEGEKSIESITEDVYRFFTKRNSIFIFDNAEDYKGIRGFLPHSSHSNNKKPHVLITSRCRDWDVEQDGEVKVLPLEVFNPDEAETFVKDFLEIEDNMHKKDIEELAKQLQYFPLALQQAVAYIKQESKKSDNRGSERFGISSYLKERQRHENKLLDKGDYKNSERYTQTVMTTWDTTLKKIAKKECGGQAIDILHIMAYFPPDRIDVQKLFAMPSHADKIWEPIELLGQYSMISLKTGIVDIHGLVQEVTRLALERKNKTEEVLRNVLKGIDNSKISEEDTSHIISVWDYASKYPELINDFFNTKYGNDKDTPIHFLVRGGKKDGVDRILKEKPSAKNDRNLRGQTPLYEAIVGGHNEIVRYLIEDCEVDPNNDVANHGYKPITGAALLDKEDLVRYFVSKGANINKSRIAGLSVIDFAAINGNKSLIEFLINEGAEVNSCHLFGGVLHSALYSGTCEDDICKIIKLCLQKDHNIIKRFGPLRTTPLHLSIVHGFTSIVEMLLDEQEGIDIINVKTDIRLPVIHQFNDVEGYEKGYTALHIAAEKDHVKIVELLLKNGAHYNARNIENKTPLDLSKLESDVKNLLICIGNLFKAVQDGNKNEVHSSLKGRNRNALEAILYARNSDGKTLIRFAGETGKKHIVSFLVEKLKEQ